MTTPVANTLYGRISGSIEDDILVFRGIPYGDTVSGSNRFTPPRPPQPWSGIREALHFGPTAPQLGHAEAGGSAPQSEEAAKRAKIFGELIHNMAGDEPAQGEDCLVLNVWTKSLEANRSRAVMVWIHGGAFETGSGSWPLYDGKALAARDDAIVVTLNHRLGPLGFLDLRAYDQSCDSSGNLGMLDIVQALRWIQNNIANFGGDPNKVMVFGSSGGASKISTLMAMPAAKGLIHRAAMMSGPYIRARSEDYAQRITAQLVKQLNIGDEPIAALRELPPEVLLKEVKQLSVPIDAGLASSASPEAFMPMQPVLHPDILPAHPMDPIASPHGPDIPVMIGSTKDDMKMMMLTMPWFNTIDDNGLEGIAQATFGEHYRQFLDTYRSLYPDASPTELACQFVTDRVMWSGSIDWAERRLKAKGAPVYFYRFDYETPVMDGLLGATHGGDIPFAMNNYNCTEIAGDRPENAAMGKQTSDAFVAFAHNGTPETAEIGEWPAYTLEERATMLLDVQCKVTRDPMKRLRELFAKMRGDS